MPENRFDGGSVRAHAEPGRHIEVPLRHEAELLQSTDTLEGGILGVGSNTEGVVNYYFPVEIEVRAAPDLVDLDEIADRTLSRLAQGLENT